MRDSELKFNLIRGLVNYTNPLEAEMDKGDPLHPALGKSQGNLILYEKKKKKK